MPEPEGDNGTIDSLLQQIESYSVPQYMNGDTFLFQRRTELGSCRGMPNQQVVNAIRAETTTSGVWEQHVLVASLGFAEPGFQNGNCGFGERHASLFAAFTDHTHVGVGSECNIAALEPGSMVRCRMSTSE